MKKKRNQKKNFKNTKTVEVIVKQSKFEYVVANLICLFAFLAFGFIAIVSIFQTSVIDPEKYSAEVILYQTDNILLNIILFAVLGLFIFCTRNSFNFFSKINMKYMEIGIFAFSLILGLIWVCSVNCVPAADSYNIFETATEAAQGDYTSLHNGYDFYNKDYYNGYSYYNYYPFQLGFVFICEIIYRMFGTASSMPVQIINVLCVSLAYLGIAKITKLVFKRRSIEFFAIILLAGCFQPILFSTFAYGNIIGMCCAIWASLYLIKYFQTESYKVLIPCAILLVLATLAKYNNMIYLVAFGILLLVHTIIKKKWQSIAFALALCIATVGASNLVIKSYEMRAGVELNDGVSQILYLDMGLNESYMAPGWYNGIALNTYKINNLDSEAANAQAKADLETRLDTMGSDLGYTAEFFSKKIISQWNESTFESIWVSKVKQHSQNDLTNAVYDGLTGKLLESYFNIYMQFVYVLFAIGLVALIVKKKANIETILLPLVMLGGFGYHLLFEGKSQYIMTYIILLIPVCAFGLSQLYNFRLETVKAFFGKFKKQSKVAEISEK
ncbi:MAG: glycosyltransferase family 39 protein [Ruminococcus sp.]|nr:glycosyltransferase family 39 protein [Ruminococcus sp.]